MRMRLGVLLAAMMVSVLPQTARSADTLPIVFVHGDSDTSALWVAQMWRFESNGYSSDLFFPVDIAHPSARGDDSATEANRSSTKDAAMAVAARVDEALSATGAKQVVLVANSRGCQTSRNYVKNFGGLGKVAKMVLTGCVHNGVFVAPGVAPNSEYNGAGTFLKALNEKPVVPEDVDVTVLRSDKFDLYSQPDGKFLGNAGNPTGANFSSPELEGATNLVLPGADHRETAYSPEAFTAMFTAITGAKPETTDITQQDVVVLSGKISGWENDAPTNMPLTGAKLQIFSTNAATGARLGPAVYEITTASDGAWGEFSADPSQSYEFVVQATGYPVTHIFRSPFPRSSKFTNLRLYPAVSGARGFVNIMRPRGYLGPDDKALVNDKPMPGIPADEPVPHVWKVAAPVKTGNAESVMAEFNGETIAALSPAGNTSEVYWIEFTY